VFTSQPPFEIFIVPSQSFSFNIGGTDPDTGQTVHLDAVPGTIPGFATFTAPVDAHSVSTTISGTPLVGDAGSTYHLHFTLSD